MRCWGEVAQHESTGGHWEGGILLFLDNNAFVRLQEFSIRIDIVGSKIEKQSSRLMITSLLS